MTNIYSSERAALRAEYTRRLRGELFFVPLVVGVVFLIALYDPTYGLIAVLVDVFHRIVAMVTRTKFPMMAPTFVLATLLNLGAVWAAARFF